MRLGVKGLVIRVFDGICMFLWWTAGEKPWRLPGDFLWALENIRAFFFFAGFNMASWNWNTVAQEHVKSPQD